MTDVSGVVLDLTIGLLGISKTVRGTSDVWSYPNIHGDVVATANASGVEQGATVMYTQCGLCGQLMLP